ncbi:AraC family transcriptional regulator [Pedobacter gandavensis]|uniref:AraC family transcriptional regulator n=1 Tax=Pedobacter gandavensis TaxID=2679963 RepID=UPI00292DBB53|nr:AraC family transcriptional regulator [Pedobacter gandavensis]
METNTVHQQTIFVKEINVKNLTNPVHFHNEYELVLITQSKGRRIVGDSIENFEEGDLVLIGPNLPHVMYNDKSYYEPENKQPVTATVMYFRMDWLKEEFVHSKEIPQLHDLLLDINRGIKVYGDTHKQVVLLLNQLIASKGLGRIIHLLSILNLLSESKEYICLSSLGYTNPHNQKDVQRISKIYNYIMANFTEDISLETAATLASMTTSAFCKYFKARTQKTFTHFVNEIRIGHACKLLFDDHLSMTEICYQSGFNNLTNFNRNFKLYTRLSPSEFKKNLKI